MFFHAAGRLKVDQEGAAEALNVRLEGCDIAQMFAHRVVLSRGPRLKGFVEIAVWPLVISHSRAKGCRELPGDSAEEAQNAREAGAKY